MEACPVTLRGFIEELLYIELASEAGAQCLRGDLRFLDSLSVLPNLKHLSLDIATYGEDESEEKTLEYVELSYRIARKIQDLATDTDRPLRVGTHRD